MSNPKPMPPYWMLAEEVTHLRGHLDKAQAENAELREERDTYRDLVGLMDHPDLNVQLQAENDALRELVRHALTFCVNGYCSEYDGCMWTVGKSGCSFADRAKKLGVEVEG